METITGNGTDTITVTAKKTHTFHVAGTWAGATVTLQWSDGTTDVAIQAFTADGAVEFTPPTNTVKVVAASVGTGGSLLYEVRPVIGR